MFPRGSHEANNSQIKLGGTGDFNLPAEEIPALLRDRFSLDMAENVRRWAELTARQAPRRYEWRSAFAAVDTPSDSPYTPPIRVWGTPSCPISESSCS